MCSSGLGALVPLSLLAMAMDCLASKSNFFLLSSLWRWIASYFIYLFIFILVVFFFIDYFCSAFMLLETLQFYILWGSIMYIYYCIYIYSLQCIVLYLCLLLCRVLHLCLSRFVKPSQIVTNTPFVMLHAYWVRQLTIIHTYC